MITLKIAENWKDYEILDMSNGMKIEKWNNVILSRPDPQIVWKKDIDDKLINHGDVISERQIINIIKENFA